jgi:c-di-GMP-binding flagellar brake protein YcgR
VQLLVDGYLVAHGELADLSLGGASLWTTEGFRSGDTLEFHFEVEDARTRSFRTTARVVWSREALSADGRTRCGIRWAHLATAEEDQLEQLIASACAER